MGQTVNMTTVIATKLSTTGNFQLIFQNGLGGIQFVVVIPSADMATIAALGSGATTTKSYGQDVNRSDYPQHIVHAEGN